MNKKMMTMGMSALLLAAAGLGSFGNGKLVHADEVTEKPSEVTITLHKKAFSTVPEERPNSGLISDDFGNENLPGVDFEMFDVTDVYYNLLKDDPRTTDIDDDGLEPADAISLIQSDHTAAWFVSYGLESIDKQTTGENGEAVFGNVQVTETTGELRDKVYLFLETYSPAHISRIASPMVVMMPVMMPEMENETWDGKTWKNTYNNDVHLYPKNEIQDSSKEMNVDEADVRTVTIRHENGETETIRYVDLEKGKTVSYTITAPIPYFIDEINDDNTTVITHFTITDTPTEGLSYFDQELLVQAGDTTLVEGTDYTVTKVGNGFVVEIILENDGIPNTETLTKLGNHRGGNLTVTYDLQVNAVINADEFHNNTALIEIGRGDQYDYNERRVPPEEVTTGGRRFEKYDASSNGLLSGARFELWNADKDAYAVFYKDGARLPVYESGADAEEITIVWVSDNSVDATEFVSGDRGYFEVVGLDYGTYFMKETVAPEGYVLPTGDAAFTEFSVELGSYDDGLVIVDYEYPGAAQVPNVRQGWLPSTGGNGILAFLLIGLSLMLGAYSWYRKSKMKSEV
ncbi:SpaH/EbpB family LPXTG-anchored major pilin [Enterococcus sp. ZJ1622]|uniref:SpaH/EbpB family LPXTG-anchored major pilin n=1 Tax=Enterococcus sp. ZJ1622 TaxID=2709401 RepID=UPI0013EA86D7|nr:SpaH/EbpB family LPXTG-anchored major pilin [Enterococcus sp. ZJ1622]